MTEPNAVIKHYAFFSSGCFGVCFRGYCLFRLVNSSVTSTEEWDLMQTDAVKKKLHFANGGYSAHDLRFD